MLESDNNELKELIKKLDDKNKKLEKEREHFREMNIYLNSKISKIQVERELLSKDLGVSLNSFWLTTKNYKGSSVSFYDVLKEQAVVGRKAKLAAKYAYKWLFNFRRNQFKETA